VKNVFANDARSELTTGVATYFIIGGAGFIGSNLTLRLLAEEANQVTVFDNYSSGKDWHFRQWLDSPRLRRVHGDVKDLPALTEAMRGHSIIYHFASNPDIARAATDPTIDFWEGTYLTQNVLEAMRISGAGTLLYASGSGVYGDGGEIAFAESYSPLRPVSTYGASKLAGEALICSYCHMFGLRATCLRFANVVGSNQTHGVGFDFIRKLWGNPRELQILGDGQQSKSYIHVQDVIAALRLFETPQTEIFDCYNAATKDYITVSQIADLVVELLGLKDVQYRFTGGDRGWKGDVPVVRFNSDKLRARGWANARTCEQALREALRSMIEDVRAGHIPTN
jgi:UDP-glucose 4-epimerase